MGLPGFLVGSGPQIDGARVTRGTFFSFCPPKISSVSARFVMWFLSIEAGKDFHSGPCVLGIIPYHRVFEFLALEATHFCRRLAPLGHPEVATPPWLPFQTEWKVFFDPIKSLV